MAPVTTSVNAPTPSKLDKKVCVVGVGYVGEHLVTVFAKEYNVFGFDVSPSRVEYLQTTYGNISNLSFSSDENVLVGADMYCISVPTLLRDDKTIDDTYVKAAAATVSKYAKPGSLVVMESSVFVGMTRDVLGQLREKGVFVAFSPERVDPGRTVPAADEIPKIIAGMDIESGDAIKRMYGDVFNKVVPVSTMETAEMCKLYENCFRVTSICFANETADACAKHGIDPVEMVNACATKPFGFMPFYPGVGVGGHCLSVNSVFLAHNNDMPFLMKAHEYNHARPAKKANDVARDYPDAKRVLVVGVGFKPGQSVVSYSPGMGFANALAKHDGMHVMAYDPLVDHESPLVKSLDFVKDVDFNEDYITKNFDMVYVATKQHKVDWNVLGNVKNSVKVVFGV